MKNMLELPTGADYHDTVTVETSQKPSKHGYLKKDEVLIYKKSVINMRNIVDVSEFKLNLTILDEEKLPEFEEKMKALKETRSAELFIAEDSNNVPYDGGPFDGEGRTFRIGPEFMGQPIMGYPEPPTKDMEFKGTVILYANTIQRVLVDDYAEFKELYFNYLKRQKLDID